MSEDWLKKLKERLDSHESPVPEGVWEGVEASLFPEKAPKVRFMPWVWAIAAAAALALGVFTGIRLIDGNGDKGIDTIEDNRIAESPASPDNNISSSSADDEGGLASSAPVPVQIVPAPAGSGILALADNRHETVAQEIPSEAIPDVEMAPDQPETVQVVVDDNKKEDKDTGFKTDHDGEDWSKYLPADGNGGDRRAGKPSAGLSLSSAASNSEYFNTMDTKPFFVGYAANFDEGTRNDGSIYTRTVSVPVSKDADHKRPIRFALSVDLPVTKALSFETGLTYSILQSVFTTSSGTRVSEETQNLGYLGIPLDLKVNLLDRDMFTVYLSGGGMVEKCVSAVSKTVVTVGGEKSGNVDRRNFSVKPLVWSVNGGAGFQFNLPGGFGIYAEPGVSYHFADNSKVSSIYTEHPFDFVLTFGTRFSFR